jgi:hypothetical protein
MAASVVTGGPASLTFAQEREYTAQGRAMIVTFWLLHGDGLTIDNVMTLTGLSRSGAYRLMTIVCYHLPVYNENGVWQLCVMKEVE